MAKVNKSKLNKYIVVVDTNILFHEDKSYPVNPEFDTFWEKHKLLVDIELYIPEVVRGELLFQQTQSANKLFDKVKLDLIKGSSIIGKNITIKTTFDSIKSNVEAKIDRWIARFKAKVIKTPYLNIDRWEEMVRKSIWRTPPFEIDPNVNKKEDRKFEKGFRDALIYETLLWIIKSEDSDVNIVFITADKLLFNTAKAAMGNNVKYSCFESLNEFSSHIRMLLEEKDKSFVDAIHQKATKKFFDNDDQESLYYKFNIEHQLDDKFNVYLSNPDLVNSTGSLALALGAFFDDKTKQNNWNPKNPGAYYIYNSRFESIEDERVYIWKNEIEFVRLYENKEPIMFPDRLFFNKYRILKLPCTIFWKVEVRANGHFYGAEQVNIEYGKGEFKVPTNEEEQIYKLDGYMMID